MFVVMNWFHYSTFFISQPILHNKILHVISIFAYLVHKNYSYLKERKTYRMRHTDLTEVPELGLVYVLGGQLEIKIFF